jgi:heparosan-N-sulfate-glucuronate 5-epimerase
VFLSDAVFHPLRLGDHIDPARPRGYYIDLSAKAESPSWPPAWLAAPASHFAIALAQWGLACHERLVAGEGDPWLDATVAAGNRLLDDQEPDGRWLDPRPYPHTFRIPAPWPSAMAQGEGASLLVRLFARTGDDRFAAGAARALEPYRVPTDDGGVLVRLGEGPFYEEYPTRPPSFVLNGGIFALFGAYDVAVTLGDESARQLYDEGVDTLAANISRWDTGRWSRYDLFPHPIVNVAHLGYHRLHIAQLRALHLLTPRLGLDLVADRFERYAESRSRRAETLARKIAFRLLVRRPLRPKRRPLPA